MSARKLTYDELFNLTTMFYINEQFEADIEQEVRSKTADIYLKRLCDSVGVPCV